MANQAPHYSFSRMSLVNNCAYAYYLEKIEPVERGGEPELVESAFAQNGDLVHKLLCEWADGKLPKEALAFEYETRYPEEVTIKWPKIFGNDLGASTYRKTLEYFENFDGFPDWTIISAEQMFETDIEGRKFIGFIDMIAQNKEDGSLIIIDHKSKSLSSFKKSQKEMYRQQYLYSKYFYEKYGKYPDLLGFNLFKDNTFVTKPFNMEEYEEALSWAEEQINKIENNDFIDWLETKEKSDFFCQHLCSVRHVCPMGNG